MHLFLLLDLVRNSVIKTTAFSFAIHMNIRQMVKTQLNVQAILSHCLRTYDLSIVVLDLDLCLLTLNL